MKQWFKPVDIQMTKPVYRPFSCPSSGWAIVLGSMGLTSAWCETTSMVRICRSRLEHAAEKWHKTLQTVKAPAASINPGPFAAELVELLMFAGYKSVWLFHCWELGAPRLSFVLVVNGYEWFFMVIHGVLLFALAFTCHWEMDMSNMYCVSPLLKYNWLSLCLVWSMLMTNEFRCVFILLLWSSSSCCWYFAFLYTALGKGEHCMSHQHEGQRHDCSLL